MKEKREILPRDEAIEKIKWYIVSNNLRPHTKLPSERQMCKMWDISRSTVRVAIKRLIEEHVIYSEKGSGTYVSSKRLVRNLHDAKSTSESMRGTGYFLWTDVLETKIEPCDKVIASKLEIDEGTEVFYIKRVRIRKNVPFMIEKSYVKYEDYPNIEDCDYREQSLYKVLSSYGVTPIKGHETIGITYASNDESSILQVERGEFLFCQVGVTLNLEGQVIEYFENVSRPDEVQFTSRLRRGEER